MYRASRGLGLELVRQLTASETNIVIAAARNISTAPQLSALQADRSNLHIVQLDVNDEKSLRESVAQVEQILGERGLDVLYNNAGIVSISRRSAGHRMILTRTYQISLEDVFGLEYASLQNILQTNLIAPAFLGKLYLPLLERGTRKTIVNVSSSVGSIGESIAVNFPPTYPSYALTKTALNMLVWCPARELSGVVLTK